MSVWEDSAHRERHHSLAELLDSAREQQADKRGATCSFSTPWTVDVMLEVLTNVLCNPELQTDQNLPFLSCVGSRHFHHSNRTKGCGETVIGSLNLGNYGDGFTTLPIAKIHSNSCFKKNGYHCKLMYIIYHNGTVHSSCVGEGSGCKKN